jgi:CRP/FNR family cyclic AMP-dependent transcriptional regulator
MGNKAKWITCPLVEICSTADVYFAENMIWLDQKGISMITGRNIRTISDHLMRVPEEMKTFRKIRKVQMEGMRTVKRNINCYSYDTFKIIASRMQNIKCASFFGWAERILRRNTLSEDHYISHIEADQGYMPDTLRNNLASLPNWRELRDHLAENHLGEIKKYQKGEFLYQQGEPAKFILLIIKGKLKINYVSDTGKQFVQRIFNTGSITGIVPLLLQSNHESSCEAVGNTEVIQLRIEELLHLLTDRPNISIELMRQLSFSVRYYAWTSRILSDTNMKNRMMECLHRIAYEYGERTPQGTIKIAIRLTQETMAEMISVSRQNVSTFLNRLQSEGIIDKTSKEIVIIQPWF